MSEMNADEEILSQVLIIWLSCLRYCTKQRESTNDPVLSQIMTVSLNGGH